MEPKKQILIVEDHQLFREGLKAMLSPCPEYEIGGEAEDGLEAIRLIRKSKPDLVLLDLSMPRMNGFRSCGRSRRRCLKSRSWS